MVRMLVMCVFWGLDNIHPAIHQGSRLGMLGGGFFWLRVRLAMFGIGKIWRFSFGR